MQVRHIFVGIDLGDKNSVARIAIDQEKSQRRAFMNNRQGRARLFEEVKRQAEQAGGGLDAQIGTLNAAVRRMGETVAVRLGLSRAFEHQDAPGPALCWLMADGFFSLAAPQP